MILFLLCKRKLKEKDEVIANLKRGLEENLKETGGNYEGELNENKNRMTCSVEQMDKSSRDFVF